MLQFSCKFACYRVMLSFLKLHTENDACMLSSQAV